MKDKLKNFFVKNKKLIIIILISIFVLGGGGLAYKIFIYDKFKADVFVGFGTINTYKIIDINEEPERDMDEYGEYYNKCGIISESIDGSLSFRSDEIPVIGFSDYTEEPIGKDVYIKVYSIKDADQYADLAKMKPVDVKDLEIAYILESKIRKNAEEGRASTFDFGKTLEKGYYLAEYNVEGICSNFYQFIQISDMSIYVANTERNLLVWAMNPNTNKPIENADIYFEEKTAKTDSAGIAKIENLTNEGDTYIRYLKIKNNDDEMLVAVNNYNSENYYNGFIYTDRPIYKATDTINLWGFVPIDLFIDEITEKFEIEFNGKRTEVNVDEDGIFKTTLKLNNFNGDEYGDDIWLYYNDKKVAYTNIFVVDYIKPEIEYSINTNKNNYYKTDTITASVKASYLTGEPEANKTLYVNFDNENYECITNEKGICSVKLNLSDYEGKEYYDDYTIFNEGLYLSDNPDFDYEDYEYAFYDDYNISYDILASANISILNRDIRLSVERNMIANDKYYYNVKVEKISIKNDEFIYTKINKNVDITINKSICKNSVGEYKQYNPYTKKIETFELYSDGCDLQDDESIEKSYTTYISSGEKEFTNLNYLATVNKEKEYMTVVSYEMEFKTYDSYGNTISETIYNPYRYINNYYLTAGGSSGVISDYAPYCYDVVNGCLSYPILLYRNISEYYINKKYSLEDKLDLRMYSNEVTEKTNGTRLSYFFKESVMDASINSDQTIYKEEYFPGVDIGGAYYDNDSKYISLVNRDYLDFDETDRKVDINLVTNKSTYKPNDEVTLNIKVTDSAGKGVKTNVLISVVDEAIFLLSHDRNDEISNIYNDKEFPFYQYSSHQELPFVPGGAGATGDGNGLSRVSDTIYFENIKTNSNGEATIAFNLNELETKFRITAIAVNNDLYYGTDVIKIVSSN